MTLPGSSHRRDLVGRAPLRRTCRSVFTALAAAIVSSAFANGEWAGVDSGAVKSSIEAGVAPVAARSVEDTLTPLWSLMLTAEQVPLTEATVVRNGFAKVSEGLFPLRTVVL